jgi:thiol-disulfide isomerase/thioredoxin
VILDGIPGTAMPGYRLTLRSADVDVLTEYVYQLATARPPIEPKDSKEQQLLREAGLVDLRGSDPPPLNLSDAEGNTLALTDLTWKLVLIHFWGTACLPCLAEMPHLETLAEQTGLTVLHVCVDAEDALSAQELASRVAPGVTAWIDETGLGPIRFQALTLPTVWLIAPDGKAIGRATGAKAWDAPEMKRFVESFVPDAPDDRSEGQ